METAKRIYRPDELQPSEPIHPGEILKCTWNIATKICGCNRRILFCAQRSNKRQTPDKHRIRIEN